MNTIVTLALISAGCSTSSDQPNVGASALVRGDGTVFAFVNDQKDASRLPEIVAGARPDDFFWFAISIPASSEDRLYSPAGLRADLASSVDRVGFAQTYRDVCTPGVPDSDTCFFVEEYHAGDPGLTGSLSLKVDEKLILGLVDLQWKGVAENNGEPYQKIRGVSLPIALPVPQ